MTNHVLRHVPNAAGLAALATLLLVAPLAAAAEPIIDYLLEDKLEAAIGTGVQAGPRYMGSRDTRATIVPVLLVQRGIFFIDTSRGAGLQMLTDSGLYASQSVRYDQGRGEKSDLFRPGSRDLAGMGEVQGSLTSHTMIAQQLPAGLSVSAEADATLRSGLRRQNLRLGAEWSAIDAGGERLTFDVAAYWGDSRFNQAYFGVTPAQAANSRFAAYRAPGGLYAYSAGAEWEHKLADHWYGSMQLTAMPFAERAKASPLMARKSSLEAVLTVRYVY